MKGELFVIMTISNFSYFYSALTYTGLSCLDGVSVQALLRE